MQNIFKKTNGLGNPMFEISTLEGRCKIIFDNNGRIIKAFYGEQDILVLIYSRDDQNDECLKDAMYQMLVLSQECFMEMFSEIKYEPQIICAKEVASRRNSELTELSIQAAAMAIQLNSIL